MTKIYPNTSSSSGSSSSRSSERETFTVWMKSLVFNGYGCTIFDSRGEVAFRVDNYQEKCSREVLLMDSIGNILFSIRKKLRIFGRWDGFKHSNDDKRKNWFQVRRNRKIFGRDLSCRVMFKSDLSRRSCYRILGSEGKSTLKIVDFSGQLLAEAIQKHSSMGVPLGEDVLTLMVEPHADRSLVIALITVYGLINNKL